VHIQKVRGKKPVHMHREGGMNLSLFTKYGGMSFKDLGETRTKKKKNLHEMNHENCSDQ
jgi:hypothetical protein